MKKQQYPPWLKCWKIPNTEGAWAGAELRYPLAGDAPEPSVFVSEEEHRERIKELEDNHKREMARMKHFEDFYIEKIKELEQINEKS